MLGVLEGAGVEDEASEELEEAALLPESLLAPDVESEELSVFVSDLLASEDFSLLPVSLAGEDFDPDLA